ncbi:MAG: complex I subunit 5 family protein [Thiobacillus sp.]|nr:MAG: hypothetical protein B7X91_02045 [Hydrogenophilales bacterium 17-64-11]
MVALTALALLLPWLLALALGPRAARPVAERLACLAPLPALVLALTAPDGLRLDVPWLLLGSRFALDDTGRMFLGVTALVWLLAGWYARGYLAGDPRRRAFQAFFLITQAGNLGVCLAADAASFYFFFAAMTFAAYGLVVHTGSREAHRAGRVYLAMAVLGEAALVAGMLLAVRAAGSHHLADLAAASPPAVAVWLLVAGFGIKAGVPLLHMWLPLAHPVAPVPASAVLSGVMLKAGLLGWLRFLPLGGAALPEVGTTLMAAGLAAMFLGVAAGLAQRDAKVLLAYSSVSQMGFMTLGVGAGLKAPELWPALLPAVVLYAVHHALAKGALFLGVGVAGARGGHRLLLAGMALPALALAGAPFSSGMWAKLELKAALGGLPAPWEGLLAWLLPLAALATGLLMARLLILVAGREARGDAAGLALPWWCLILAGLAAPFWLAPAGTRILAATPLAMALAPVLLAWGLAHAARRLALRGPAIPPGDLLVLLERMGNLPSCRRVKHWLGRI